MAANVAQIYPIAGDTQWSSTALVTANADRTGATGTTYTIYTATTSGGGGNGTNLYRLRLMSRGNNAASVCRVFVNNGSTIGTAANNILIDEVSLPQTTASELAANPNNKREVILNIPFFQAGYVIFCTLGTGLTDGWSACVIASKY